MTGQDTVPVAEVFGPTFQGEGPSTGTLASFVRLGGCNLTCRACDTPYTWDASRYSLRDELTPMTVAEILAKLPVPHPRVTVVTGGEPLMYQHRRAMHELLGALTAGPARRAEIETNGTLAPHPDLAGHPRLRFNVSPKLDGPMSVDPVGRRIVPAALAAFAGLAEQGRAVFKLVVATPVDVEQAAALVVEHRIPAHAVWIMPEGTTSRGTLTAAREVADTVLAYGFNLTLRQHVLLWPDTERGR